MSRNRISPGGAPARAWMLGQVVTGILLVGGCDKTPEVFDPEALPAPSTHVPGVTATASGGGHFHNPAFGVDVQFAFTAVQLDHSGAATGTYHFTATSLTGLAIDVRGRISCMTTDPTNPGRAWMGGLITKNESEHPVFTGETSRVGRDGWFRVVDYGEGSNAAQPDRATMIFFEPAGGFTNAADFCDSQLWFAGDRLTNPLLNGAVQVNH